MFEKLIEVAADKLATVTERLDGLPAPQVIVLLTNNHKIYVTVNDVDGTICETLKRNHDTKILQMLAMWKGESLDLPSYDFRQALVELDSWNLTTGIVLQGKDGLTTKKLSETLS